MLRKLISLVMTAVFLLVVCGVAVAHNGQAYIPNDLEPTDTGDEHPWGGENQLTGPSLTQGSLTDQQSIFDSGRLIRVFGGMSFYGVPVLIYITTFSTDEIDAKDTDTTPTLLDDENNDLGRGGM